jgi:hypothetical protein
VDHVRPWSTVDWPWTVAPSSPELGLRSLRCPRAPAKGRVSGSGTREPDGPLTGAWEAVRRPDDGGEDGSGRNFGAESTWAQRVRRGELLALL